MLVIKTYQPMSVSPDLCMYIYVLKLEITRSKVICYINAILKFITEVTFSVCETFNMRPSQCIGRNFQ